MKFVVAVAFLIATLAFNGALAKPVSTILADFFDDIFNFDIHIPTPKGGNTTSEVKIVNGHRIETNRTTYHGDSVVSIVETTRVRPVVSGEGETDVEVVPLPGKGNLNPVTTAPISGEKDNGSRIPEFDDRREPLEKDNNDNEINHDIDEPQVNRSLVK